jgi:hypothetical protein
MDVEHFAQSFILAHSWYLQITVPRVVTMSPWNISTADICHGDIEIITSPCKNHDVIDIHKEDDN